MSFLVSTLLLTLTVINVVLIIFVLFFERQESSRRFAWILALTFLPIVGMILYILFSGHFFTKTKKMTQAKKFIHADLKKFLDFQKEQIDGEIQKNSNPIFSEFETLLNMNFSYGSSPLTLNNDVEVFLWGKDKFASLFADIENARETINLEYFIIHNDVIGNQLMDLLCKKAEQGVQVRFLYDDFGSLFTPSKFFKRLDKAGGKAVPFFPVRNGFLFSVNYRNHRKIVVIDGKIGYMGGFNVGDEYVNQSKRKRVLWRDTHIRLTGGSVLLIQLTFLVDWYSVCSADNTIEDQQKVSIFFPAFDSEALKVLANQNSHRNAVKMVPIQIISSGPNVYQDSEIKDAMIRMIMSARKTIFIQTPYFTPDDAFYSALKIAAMSGIDIRIMVPDKWDKFYVKAAAAEYIREMLGFGVKFYHYPGFIHSKTVVIDGKIATIGSTNIDARSFSLHFEINAFFYSAEFAKLCEDTFLSDQQKSRVATKDWYDNRFILVRAWWGFCKLFSSLM